jgi:two-component system, OmpR family, phosphate regulon sensor histidine kinase PhoR
MFERRSLRLPITLGVIMIVVLVVLTVGWVLLTAISALSRQSYAPLFWTLLAVGTSLLVLVLVGVIIYLTLSVKAINLNQRQTNFVDAVTHELKSPIASLKLCLQTLTRQEVSDEQRREFQGMMLEDVERLDQLINHLLDAARLDRTRPPPAPEEVRLDELLEECCQTTAERYHLSPGVLTTELQPCVVLAPREDLTIIFRNLLDNAVKYASTTPQVRLALVAGEHGEPVVQVEDNGSGIPVNLRRRIFGRFVRLGQELERERPGTGLGLYIVKTLIQRLRGKIRVRSGRDGHGTIFEVSLPKTCLCTPIPSPSATESATPSSS